MAATPGETLVARLLDVVGGDAPISDAAKLLAPDVICHMDHFTARGVDAWVDWVEFMQSRSAEPLVAHVERYVTRADGTITAVGCLRRRADVRTTPCQGEASYKVANGRIVEIWTSRGNYEIIFGARARRTVSWLLVLLQLIVWRRLPWRKRARTSHPSRGSSDRDGNESRHRREADDDPERRDTD